MHNMVVYEERSIKPKGTIKGILPDERKIREYLFEDEFAAVTLLSELDFPHTQASFLYPGCGADILFPLLFLEKSFPQLKEAEFTFIDLQDNQKLIETVLDDLGISFSRKKNRLDFYWKEMKVTLTFTIGNIFHLIDSLPTFDLYFERSFRIMKEGYPNYEQKIVEKLNPEGILISDSGFQNTSLQKIDMPKELSKYGEMVVGRKE